MSPAFRLLPHTADAAFEATAPSWEGLLAEATRALGEVLLADDGSPPDCELPVEVTGADREDLLVAWLGAALLGYEQHGRVPRGARLATLDPTRLGGVVLARQTDPRRQPPDRVVKAVTYHALAVEPGEATRPWRAVVVLDL
ncbi:MAG: archease [Planctomycetia bacterium]